MTDDVLQALRPAEAARRLLRTARLVTHIDEGADASVTAHYDELASHGASSTSCRRGSPTSRTGRGASSPSL